MKGCQPHNVKCDPCGMASQLFLQLFVIVSQALKAAVIMLHWSGVKREVSVQVSRAYVAYGISSVSSVAQSCPTLCDPMDCSTPGLPGVIPTNSWGLLKLMSMESVVPSNHLILCHPLLLPPSVFPSIRVFSSESVLCIRWPKYWSFSFSISPSNEHSGLISSRMDWLDIHSYLPLWASRHHCRHSFLASSCLIFQQDYPSTGFFTHTSQEGFREAFSEQSSSDSRFKEKHIVCNSSWTKSTASPLPDFLQNVGLIK